jgi:hypothetical protein
MTQLETKLGELDQKKPFTFVIDLTRGQLSKRISMLDSLDQLNELSISRVRQATDIDLPTTGHLLSHNVEEIRNLLIGQSLDHVLVLDDTSFSGSTSLLVEDLLGKAFPEKNINFTHGFLILNSGTLGKNPGAKERLSKANSRTVSGMEMKTPRDDGWHFFDMVNQANIENHLLVVKELISLMAQSEFKQLASTFLAKENNLKFMFPQLVAKEDLLDLQKSGHFVAKAEIIGDFHVKNPQLLANIIGQNHLMSPEFWQTPATEAFALLIKINHLLKKGFNNEKN